MNNKNNKIITRNGRTFPIDSNSIFIDNAKTQSLFIDSETSSLNIGKFHSEIKQYKKHIDEIINAYKKVIDSASSQFFLKIASNSIKINPVLINKLNGTIDRIKQANIKIDKWKTETYEIIYELQDEFNEYNKIKQIFKFLNVKNDYKIKGFSYDLSVYGRKNLKIFNTFVQNQTKAFKIEQTIQTLKSELQKRMSSLEQGVLYFRSKDDNITYYDINKVVKMIENLIGKYDDLEASRELIFNYISIPQEMVFTSALSDDDSPIVINENFLEKFKPNDMTLENLFDLLVEFQQKTLYTSNTANLINTLENKLQDKPAYIQNLITDMKIKNTPEYIEHDLKNKFQRNNSYEIIDRVKKIIRNLSGSDKPIYEKKFIDILTKFEKIYNQNLHQEMNTYTKLLESFRNKVNDLLMKSRTKCQNLIDKYKTYVDLRENSNFEVFNQYKSAGNLNAYYKTSLGSYIHDVSKYITEFNAHRQKLKDSYEKKINSIKLNIKKSLKTPKEIEQFDSILNKEDVPKFECEATLTTNYNQLATIWKNLNLNKATSQNMEVDDEDLINLDVTEHMETETPAQTTNDQPQQPPTL